MKCKTCNKELKKAAGYTKPYTICYQCNPHDSKLHEAKRHAGKCLLIYPEKINIMYECRCKAEKKDKHHFDYKRVFDVFLLCRKCHMAEHQRIEPGYNSNNKYGMFTETLSWKQRRMK